jgi:hypothetical protein
MFGGLRLVRGNLEISGSRFENLPTGAITNVGGYNISNTVFIDCTVDYGSSSDVSPVPFYFDSDGIFSGCTFEHTDSLYPRSTKNTEDYAYRIFRLETANRAAKVTFDNCTFTNLRAYVGPTEESYIFGNITHASTIYYWDFVGGLDLTIKNCIFTFRSDTRMGLVNYVNNNSFPTKFLLFDNVGITNNGSTQPIISLRRGEGVGLFQFRPNNRYNSTTNNLPTRDSIINLGPGVVRVGSQSDITMIQ